MRLSVLIGLGVGLLFVAVDGGLGQALTNQVSVVDIEFVAWLTGPESISQTDVNYDIDGTDLGSMFSLGDTLYIAFGDTFGCCRPIGGGAGGDNWRSNALAFSTDQRLEDGLTFDGMITDDNGNAREVLAKQVDDFTIIPTDGIAVEGRLYLHYMAVRAWGPPGQWTLNRSGWGYSDDRGETWLQPSDAVWQGDTAMGQVALIHEQDDLYLLGIPGGRFGGVSLARVPTEDILDMETYRYWDGQSWTHDIDQAATVVEAPVGEISVVWNTYLNRWIMTYLDEWQRAIVIRTAPELHGPWTDTVTLVSAHDYPALYGAYLYPHASGETIYFNMSQWHPYNVRLMRARLVKDN